MGGNVKPGSGLLVVLRRKAANGQNVTSSFTTLFSAGDHLGSTRAVMDAAGNILERNAYYPFGLQTDQGNDFPNMSSTLTALYPRYINPSATRRDLYNGKEIQTIAGTDYLDYGFRQYDQTIARWFNIDPKAEHRLQWTSFNYCIDNPIYRVDSDGCQDFNIDPDKDKKRKVASATTTYKKERSLLPSQPFLVATSSTLIEFGKKEEFNIDTRFINSHYKDETEKSSVATEIQYSGIVTQRMGIEYNKTDKKHTTPTIYGSIGSSKKIDQNSSTEIRIIGKYSDFENSSFSLSVSYRYDNLVKEYSFGIKPMGMITAAITTTAVIISDFVKAPFLPQLIRITEVTSRASPIMIKSEQKKIIE